MTEQIINDALPLNPKPPAPWLLAFIEIWIGKGNTLKLRATEWRKIASTGLIIYIAAHVLSLYLYSASPEIRADYDALLRAGKTNLPTMSANGQTRQDLGSSLDFSLTSAIQAGLFEGVKSLIFVPLLFWGCFSLIGGGVSFKTSIAGVGAGLAISAAGVTVSSLMQFLLGGLRYAPNAGVFTTPTEYPWLYGFLTNISVFSVWEYIAIGLSLAYIARYRPKIGIVAGAFIYCAMLFFVGSMSWIGRLLTQ